MPGSTVGFAGAARRRLIRAGGGIWVLALAPQGARAAGLLAVRVWPAPEYTRVTVEHEAPLRFHHFLLRDTTPLRLVVDIEGLELSPQLVDQLRRVDAADPYIARMRVGQFRAGVVRLVVELKVPVEPQVFSLDPVGPYRNRLVLDLYPAGANDPLLPLLQAPRAAQDASGAAPQAPATSAATDTAAGGRAESSPPPSSSAAPGEAALASTQSSPPAAVGAEPEGADRAAAPAAPRPPPRAMRRLVTIAVDPGHGGEDPGAVGKRGTYEKLVTLSIGRLLAALIDEQADYRVMMTRDADYFVPLAARVEKARKVQADLFVSIHADAWVRADAHGSSVFALSERGASSSAAAELARQQNASDLIGGVSRMVRDAQVQRVVLDLSTTAQISDSLQVGDAVLHELGGINRLHRGRVEQAGFAVLKAPDIPSILVETAFISNPEEEARLCDRGYQQQMAAALFTGIRGYFARHPPLVRNTMG